MDFLRRHNSEITEDISVSLRDRDAWKYGILKNVGLQGEIAIIAADVVGGLLAAATDRGYVYIFGAPAATHYLRLQGTAADAGVKHLGFSMSGTRLIACGMELSSLCNLPLKQGHIDTRNKLHVWSLSSGPPFLEGSVHVGDVVNCMATSVYHSHAFLGLKSGRTFTFDVDRVQLSPYTIPNAWQKHEAVLRRSGALLSSPTSPSFDVVPPPMVIDLAIHPRDLNLLLIGYERGIVVWNLVDQKPASHYALSLLPGAPGAMLQPERSPMLMEERSPPPTCVAWHPDGRLFAIGHMDGCISFWSVEEEDKPLDVRTVDRAGVHKVDFEAFAAAAALPPGNSHAPTHEPIYKLVWTPKRLAPNTTVSAKGSYLTVLGGLQPSTPPGIPCLYFPPFVSPANTTITTEGLDSNPALRDALIASVTPTAYAEILTNPKLTVEDILVVPEHSQMLVTKSTPDGRRTIQVEQHPPSTFVDTVGSLCTIPADEIGMGASSSKPSQAVLDARPIFAEPSPSRVPVEMMMTDLIEAKLQVMSKSGVGWLVQDTVRKTFGEDDKDKIAKDVERDRLSWLRAGEATANVEGQKRSAKFEPSRIVVGIHADNIVRFYDISSQLLLNPTPLRFEHPQSLPNLDIDPHWTLSHPLLSGFRRPDGHVRSVHFAPSSLECAVVLGQGWVLAYKFAKAGTQVPFEARVIEDGVIDLSPMSFEDEEKFRPLCGIAEVRRGEVTCAALSDVGFLAVAYEDCSVVIIDLRGPTVVLRYEPHIEQGRKSAQDGPVKVFNWAQYQPFDIHLLGITESGLARIFTLSPPVGRNPNWSSRSQPKTIKHSSLSRPIFSTVIDTTSGNACVPDATGMDRVMGGDDGARWDPSIWVAASQNRLRTYAGVLGKEIAGVERKGGKEIVCIDVLEIQGLFIVVWFLKHDELNQVTSTGEAVVAVIECDGELTIYSLPRLERLSSISIGHPVRHASSDSHGDFFTISDQNLIEHLTILNFSRAQLPLVDFSTPYPMMRDKPEPPETSGFVSWLWSARTKTGTEIDAILAGPARPPPKARRPKYVPAEKAPVAPITSVRATSSVERAANATGRDDVYSRLAAAVSERGEMLSGLEERFGHLEAASRDMASQAKRIAAQQGAKRWFGL
ncbi:potassium voltage-gated channel family protein [Ceratobasidium sp. AG-Ba]|nr:potassium voltage-gated channel family protein [Ceratobasidium sp. AG-Ba]